MIVQTAIDSTDWVAITSAGDSGTVWLDEQDDGAAGQVEVRLFHQDTKPTAGDVTKGKRLFKPRGNDDVLEFAADNTTDILWAICANSGDTATVSVDVP